MSKRRESTGGIFDSGKSPIYFIAADARTAHRAQRLHDAWLLSVSSITLSDYAYIDDLISNGHKILFDSGVFSMASALAKQLNTNYAEVVHWPVDRFPEYPSLLRRYLDVLARFGKRSWGYIETDLGGEEQKRATRETFQLHGLYPIPVYHPLSDSGEYFNYLATNYNRVCFGGMARAGTRDNARLISIAWNKKRAYPDLWVHILGASPNTLLHAFPLDSCDSASWLNALKWSGQLPCYAIGRRIGELNATYELGSDPTSEFGHLRARVASLLTAAGLAQSYRHYLHQLSGYGFQVMAHDQ